MKWWKKYLIYLFSRGACPPRIYIMACDYERIRSKSQATQSGFDTLFFLTSKPKDFLFLVLFIKWWSIIYSISFLFPLYIDSTDYNSTFTNILKLNIGWQNKDNANTTRRYFKLIPGNRFNALKQTHIVSSLIIFNNSFHFYRGNETRVSKKLVLSKFPLEFPHRVRNYIRTTIN